MTSDEPRGFLEDDANVERLCVLGGVSRAGYSRHFGPHASARDDADRRDLIQRIALADRHRGYRRVTRASRRRGSIVDAQRALRLMRADNLLALRSKPFVARTTDSRHGFAIRPNLIRNPTPSGVDQICVSDLPYIRLAEDFVYLAVVVDAFSRKVIGWDLDDHLEARLAIAALDRAIEARNPAPENLIHHKECNTLDGREDADRRVRRNRRQRQAPPLRARRQAAQRVRDRTRLDQQGTMR